MTSADVPELAAGRRPLTEPSRGKSRSRVRRLTCDLAVLLMAGLAVTACSSGLPSPMTSSNTSRPKAELPPGGKAQLSTSTALHPGESGHVSKGHARLVVNNGKISICSLISGGQVDQIMQAELPRPEPVIVGTFDECATIQRHDHSSGAAPLHVAWAVPPEPDPALYFKQITVSMPQHDAILGLGDKAYCSGGANPISARLLLIRGRTLLEVFADTCGHAAALAKVALSRL